MRDQRADPGLRLDGLEAASRFFAGHVAGSDPAAECLWVAHLDSRSTCLHLMRTQGHADHADMPIRSIILDVARLGTQSLLIAHTHPSGDCRPSESDCRVTRRLATVAEAVGCRLVDHLVFGGTDFTSFRKAGLL